MQLLKEASKLSKNQSQVEEVKSVIITDKKEVNTTEEQTTRTPYHHPNYKCYFEQRKGQNQHTHKRDDVRWERTENQNSKQQTRIPIPQSDKIALIKIDLGWTTSEMMQWFLWGIHNSFHLVSSNVIVTKHKRSRDNITRKNHT